jgi:glycosyltransferase involved in cell wall biosynthesis
MKPKISLFIIACNEADRIHLPIESCKNFVDEIIVVDSGSTDDTVKIAENLGAKVYFNHWQGYGLQKRFGEDKCNNDWILNLDADEQMTYELKDEIEAEFEKNDGTQCYEIGLRDVLPGDKKSSPLAYTKYAYRLYNKNKVRFSESPVHDSVIVIPEAKTKKLKNICNHFSFRSISHAIDKLNSYSEAQAADRESKNKSFSPLRLYFEFPLAFLKIYFGRRYFALGRKGFTFSVIYAFGRFVRVAKSEQK